AFLDPFRILIAFDYIVVRIGQCVTGNFRTIQKGNSITFSGGCPDHEFAGVGAIDAWHIAAVDGRLAPCCAIRFRVSQQPLSWRYSRRLSFSSLPIRCPEIQHSLSLEISPPPIRSSWLRSAPSGDSICRYGSVTSFS